VPIRLKIIKYTAFEFAGADKSLLDDDLGVVGVCDLDGILQPGHLIHLGDTQA